MEPLPIRTNSALGGEPVSLEGTFRGKYRGFAVFLICCALLVAAFAISAIWTNARGEGWLGGLGSLRDPDVTTPSTLPPITEEGTSTTHSSTPETPPQEIRIPEGATAIIPMDLSCSYRGEDSLHNETPYKPDVNALRQRSPERTESANGPVVLILHTHTSEAYRTGQTDYMEGAVGDQTYSNDPDANVLAVGRVLCDTLNSHGIYTVHCALPHDSTSLRGSYERAAQTIQSYLIQYPSIQYVIDLHRDSITNAKGELVRTLAPGADLPTAQIMAVVGTDGNGTPCPAWEENLALALQLQDILNEKEASLCRPVSLRNASYNQELAPRSLLLEIGSSANSIDEAKRAAALVGEALAKLLKH